MTKKITSFFLCLILIFSYVNLSENIQAAEADFDKYDVVVGLGFMDLYATGNFENSNLISRAEFAEIICKVANVPIEEGTPVFDDVDDKTMKKNYIHTAVKTGLMNGTGDNLFSPNEFVTYNQVIKTLVTLLGYDYLAKLDGGYPIGYSKYAVQSGILNGLKNGGESEISREALASFIYNALQANIVDMEYMNTAGGFAYKENITMLEAYHDILSSEGIVEANDVTYINDGSNYAEEGCVVIGEAEYSVCDTKADGMLGMNVEFYYKENVKQTYDLVCVIPKENTVHKIETDNLIRNKSSFEAIYWYDENDKEQDMVLKDDLKVIYNGVYYFGCTLSDLLPKFGDITLIDNDSDNAAEIALVNDYTLFFVSHTNLNSGAILEKDGSNLVIKDYEKVYLEKDENTYLSYSDAVAAVAAEDILLVGKSKQKDYYIKILASAEKISEKFVRTNFKNEFFTNKKTYKVNPYAASLESEIEIGETYTLLLDAKGFIADTDTSDGKNYAWLVSAKHISKGLNESLSIKLYTKNEIFETFPLASNFEIVKDGKVNKYNAETVGEAYKNFLDEEEKVKNQLVVYTLNATDELIKLEIAQNAINQYGLDGFSLNLDGTFTRNYDGILLDSESDFPAGSNGIYAVTNAVMFTVPESEDSSDINNEALYRYETNTANMSLGEDFDVEVYDADENYNCGAVVYKTSVGGSASANFTNAESVFFVIEGINETIASDGSIVKTVSGYYNGKQAEYMVQDIHADEISSLKKGDAIMISLRADGYINKYRIAVVNGQAQEVYTQGSPNNGRYYFSTTTNSAISGRSFSSQVLFGAQYYVFSGVANKVSKASNTRYDVFIDFENIDKYMRNVSGVGTVTDVTEVEGITGPISVSRKFPYDSKATAVVYYDKAKDKLWLGNYDEIEPGDKIAIAGMRHYYNSCLVIKE